MFQERLRQLLPLSFLQSFARQYINTAPQISHPQKICCQAFSIPIALSIFFHFYNCCLFFIGPIIPKIKFLRRVKATSCKNRQQAYRTAF